MSKVVHHVQIYYFAKFEHCWILGKQQIWITRFEQFLNNWKSIAHRIGPGPLLSVAQLHFFNRPEAMLAWIGPAHPASFLRTRLGVIPTAPAAALTHATYLRFHAQRMQPPP
jgi:hypothetical protein